MSFLFPSLALVIQASAPIKNTAIAATIFTFSRCLDQTVGVFFQNRMSANLAVYPSPAGNVTKYSPDVVSQICTINSLVDVLPFSFIGNWRHALILLSFINPDPLIRLQITFVPSTLLQLIMLSLLITSSRDLMHEILRRHSDPLALQWSSLVLLKPKGGITVWALAAVMPRGFYLFVVT